MQMQLPIFPQATRLINDSVGIFEKDNFVFYLHNGSPIFCHLKHDMNNYRYITGNLVNTGLCTPIEISRVIGVSNRNIQRYAKALREKGPDWFFNRTDNRGSCHKITNDIMEKAQQLIDDFYSVNDVARMLGVTEGALRYHIKKGTIKKKWSLR
jgi:biotin operon repressor